MMKLKKIISLMCLIGCVGVAKAPFEDVPQLSVVGTEPVTRPPLVDQNDQLAAFLAAVGVPPAEAAPGEADDGEGNEVPNPFLDLFGVNDNAGPDIRPGNPLPERGLDRNTFDLPQA